jgi:hypothetical protein
VSDLNGKQRLDPEVLTPRDMQRAKAGPLRGRSAYELMGDPEEMFPLIIWCLRSRDDPGFTWEQALDTPFSNYDMAGGQSPPESPTPAPSGSTPRPSGGKRSKTKPAVSAAAPSSGSTST